MTQLEIRGAGQDRRRTTHDHNPQTRTGWPWPPGYWWKWFAKLWQANAEADWPNLPQKHASGIGVWLSSQRMAYKAGTLAADRVRALEALPGFWWVTPSGRRRDC